MAAEVGDRIEVNKAGNANHGRLGVVRFGPGVSTESSFSCARLKKDIYKYPQDVHTMRNTRTLHPAA